MKVTVHDTVTISTTEDVTVDQFERFLERRGWKCKLDGDSKTWRRGVDPYAPTIHTKMSMPDWCLSQAIEVAARQLARRAAEAIAEVSKEPV